MRDRLSVFMIHKVKADAEGGPSLAALRAILEELRALRLRVVSLQSSIERHIAGEPQLPDSVAFTLDDGTSEQMEVIAPLLAKYDCEATVFLITGFVDGAVWPWDYRIDYIFSTTRLKELHHQIPGLINPICDLKRSASKRIVLNFCKTLPASSVESVVTKLAEIAEVSLPAAIPSGWRALTWDGARGLEQQGIRFAPHGVTHSILSKMSPDEARHEIRTSWERVRQEMRSPSPIFAWPTGRASDFGVREIAYAKDSGLIGAVTASCDYAVLPTVDGSEEPRYRIGRFPMPSSPLDFLQYATWIERGKQLTFRRADAARSAAASDSRL